jgi:2-(1,2-epoxy-1,2-dihydrophenyl)acetyl-CoA isomerase
MAKPAESDIVVVEVDQGIGTLKLNRPDRLNSMNTAFMRALIDGLARLADDRSVRAVLLTGAGRAFCAGADLTAGRESENHYGNLYDNLMPACSELKRFRKPVVCAVNGACAGAGVSLALSCDIVVAAESAYFLQAFLNVGLVPDCGATWVIPRLVGSARFAGMSMLAKRIPARQAADWGLIWDCLPDADLMPGALALARQLADAPPKALELTKELLRQSPRNGYEEQMVLEAQFQKICGATADSKEARQAFVEKRKPVFRGD